MGHTKALKKTGVSGERKKTLEERAYQRINLKKELARLEELIAELRLDYEQFFLGLYPYQPDKLYKKVKRHIRMLHKAPFKRSEHVYRLRMLESRFNTYNDYWQRTLRQKEDGTYSKDVFKAKMRERHAEEDKEAASLRGAAAKQMVALFNSLQVRIREGYR